MLAKTHRLTQKKDFARLSTQGRSVFGPYVTMRVRSAHEAGPRIAFITSTKVFKLAVDRNRIKRRLRGVLRELLAEVPPKIHVLFIVKPEALKTTPLQLVTEIRRLLGKIPEALTKPPKMSPGAIKQAAKRQQKKAAQPISP